MITLISGLPCSGKTLLLQMLAAGGMPVLTDDDAPTETADLRTSSAQNTAQVTPVDARWLSAAEGKACVVSPTLLFRLPASHEYRIVFMLRDMDEVLASLAKTTQDNDDEQIPPEMMRYHCERHLHRIRRLLDGPRQLAICYCDYDETLAYPVLVARQVAAFLGLRLNTQAMATVAEHPDHRNRYKPYTPPEETRR